MSRWREQRDAALRSAMDGTHGFVWVDVDAPMRTCEPMQDGTGRMRLSLDVWRRFMPDEPPTILSLRVEKD